LEVVVNASPTLFSRHAPLLLELASVEEVLVNSSPSLFVCAEPSAVRGACSTRRRPLALALDAASGTGFDPRKTCARETKKP
jgi:hypothetical protein